MQELSDKMLDEVIGGLDAHDHNVMGTSIGGQGTEGIPRNPAESDLLGHGKNGKPTLVLED